MKRKRTKDNPRQHCGHVSFSREPLTMKVWSYRGRITRAGNEQSGYRDYYVTFVDKDGRTLCQGRFLVRGKR